MKRSPLLRKTRIRRVSPKKARVRELDALCRAAVFKRDGNRCVKCGKTVNLQWCHIFSRRYQSMRWDMDNSLVLCAGDHLWQHHRPLEASRWFETLYPERAKRLLLIARTKRKPDLEAIRLALQDVA